MHMIWDAFIHTPWWVYVLLVYLIKVGVGALKTREVPIRNLFIIPCIFSLMSFHTLLTSFKIDAFTLSIWLASLVIGFLIGLIHIHISNMAVDHKKRTIEIPGSWTTLVVILLIFVAKYYFGYELARDPALMENTYFEIAALIVSGVGTGIFVGRLAYFLHWFKMH